MTAPAAPDADDQYPGESLGLPETGRGSLASWRARVAALILDWAASMALAVGVFGAGVLNQPGWRGWMILTVFFVQSSVLTGLAGGSFGQIIARIGVIQVSGRPIGIARALARQAMICLVLPTIVIGAERRALNDLALGTVVVNRR
ncbi:MAG: RDD family protein [Micropruina sp.]|nr:RDD family protein [Micropruina sp.]